MKNRKLRICIIVCDITSGGVEAVLLNYFTHINCSMYKLDLLTYGITSEICANKFRNLGFNIIKIPPKREGFMKSIKEMNKIIRSGKYDIVHTHLTEWNCIPMFLAWKSNVPIRISHSHMADFSLDFKKKIVFSFQKILNKYFANKFCACGKEAAIYLYGKKWVDKNKVQILYNAIDLKRFRPNIAVRKKIRKYLNIENNVFCVGHIGRFLEQKNHEFLIDIFFELHKKNNNSCLLLLGIGDLENKIKQKVSSLKIDTSVKFLGIKNNIEEYYQAMDVFCLPSLFEGLPVVGVESQAANVPSVVSDTISKEILITPLVKMMSLSQSANEWAEALLNSNKLKATVNYFPDEYNIEKAAVAWRNLYELGEDNK